MKRIIAIIALSAMFLCLGACSAPAPEADIPVEQEQTLTEGDLPVIENEGQEPEDTEGEPPVVENEGQAPDNTESEPPVVENEEQEPDNTESEPPVSEDEEREPEGEGEGETETMKIILTCEGERAVVALNDNDAARNLLEMLPLTLVFEDFSSTEKIANLPSELNTGSAPTSCDPQVGTFAYYAPWGNLSVFYRDFRFSENLIPLGSVESGIDIFAEKDGDFTVTIERQEG